MNEPRTESTSLSALQAAARKGNKKLVLMLLASGAHVNIPPSGCNGRTALQAALESENKDVVRILMKAGARRFDSLGISFSNAVEGGRVEIIKLLLTLEPDDGALETALKAAALVGHQQIVELLLDAILAKQLPILSTSTGSPVVPITHPGLMVKNELGQNILHISCREGHIYLVDFLLRIATKDVLNATDHLGSTATHAAVAATSLPLVQRLIYSGVDLEIKDRSGHTALCASVYNKSNYISGALLGRGAKTDGLRFNHAKTVLEACDRTAINGEVLLLSGGANRTCLCSLNCRHEGEHY